MGSQATPVGQLLRAKLIASAKLAPPPSPDQRRPSGEINQSRPDENMGDEREQAVKVFLPIVAKRIDAHPVKKHEDIPKQNGQRMPHEKVLQAPAFA